MGVVEVTTSPAKFTAAQRLVLGQDTPLNTVPGNGAWWSTTTGAAQVSDEFAASAIGFDQA